MQQMLEQFEKRSTVTSKGQVTIPVEIRRALDIGPHDQVAFVVQDNEVHLRRAARGVVARTAGALKRYARQPAPSAEELRDLAEAAWVENAAERSA